MAKPAKAMTKLKIVVGPLLIAAFEVNSNSDLDRDPHRMDASNVPTRGLGLLWSVHIQQALRPCLQSS